MAQRYDKIMFSYCDSAIIFNNIIVDLFTKVCNLFKNEHFNNKITLKKTHHKKKTTIFAPCY